MGPCAGGACYSPAISDFILMVRGTGQMFITGPAVVKEVIAEVTTPEELGGADVHMEKSGVAHMAFDTEAACLNAVRRLLSYLPQNHSEEPARAVPREPSETRSLEELVPENTRKAYDIHPAIEAIVDADSFLEIQPGFARNAVVGFARLDGQVCGIVANQPYHMAGSLDVDSSDKIARFVRFCDAFNIPLITLEDVPAFWPGTAQEHMGIIRHGAKILYAYSEATVPKITVVLRKAYGGAYIAMNSKGIGADLVFAWPIAELAVMGAEAAADVIYRKRLAASSRSEEERRELLAEYHAKLMAPQSAAMNGLVDEIILPEETRQSLINGLKMMAGKALDRIPKKHDNMPL